MKSREMNTCKTLFYANGLIFRSAPVLCILSFTMVVPEVIGLFIALSTTREIVNMIGVVAGGGPVNVQLILLLMFGSLVIYLLGTVQKCVMAAMKRKTKLRLENVIVKKMGSIQWEYFESFETARKLENVSRKSYDAIIEAHSHLYNYLSALLQMVMYLWFLRSFTWQIVVFYFAILIISILLSGRVFKSNYTIWERIIPLQQRQEYEQQVIADVHMHQESQHNRMLHWTESRWTNFFNKEHTLRLKIFRRYEIVMQLSRLIENLPYMIMVIGSGILVIKGEQDVGTLVMYLQMFNLVVNLFSVFIDNIFEDQNNAPFIRNYRELLDFKEEEVDGIRPQKMLQFDHVYYTYPGSEKNVLKGLSFEAKIGERIAVVGKNGNGKTTFTSVLMGLAEHLNKGYILVDGKKQKLSKASIQCISQNFEQYQMSIRDNVAMGRRNAQIDDQEVWKLLRKVGLSDFVEGLPGGIDTQLGQLTEGGIELSKGQWQRLALARLLADNEAVVWILDEPTAYLDPISEVEIYDLVNSLAKNKLVFFISHRLGFTRHADRILFIDDGRVTGDANFGELMETHPLFQEMYEAQQKWYQ